MGPEKREHSIISVQGCIQVCCGLFGHNECIWMHSDYCKSKPYTANVTDLGLSVL